MENIIIWGEKSYTEPPKNYENKRELGTPDIIKNTESQSKNEISKDTSKISGIYIILNKVNNKYYIGSSNNIIKGRWKSHKHSLRKNKHWNQHLQSAWNKYGEENFEFHIIELLEESRLLIVEQKYLNWCKTHPDTHYMLALDATAPMRGRTTSEETKQKLRKINTGKTLTEEHKKKISKSHMGIKPTNETLKKLRDSHIGKSSVKIGTKRSIESCEKNRMSHIGQIPWNKGKRGHCSRETIQKMRDSHLGKIPWNKKNTPL